MASTAFYFLSYAHNNGDRALVRAFYEDLSRELSLITGRKEPELLGYMDDDMPSGAEWRPGLADKLRTCQVFVALFSPSYFASVNCGKEWQVFVGRLDVLRQADGAHPALVLPLHWERPADLTKPLPESVDGFHVSRFDGISHDYIEDGLRMVVQNKKDLAYDYSRLLRRIADEIKTALDGTPLPVAARPEWSKTKNAFGPPASARRTAGSGEAPDGAGPAMGPTHVHFVVAAGTDALRRDDDPVAYYASKPTDWAPFAPKDRRPLVQIASLAALERLLMTPYTETMDDQIVARIRDAERDNQLVLLLVDPRAVGVAMHGPALREYDGRLWKNTGVIVAWNQADQVGGGSRELADAVHDALQNKISFMGRAVEEAARTVHEAIFTVEEFQGVLIRLLAFLQGIVLRRDESARKIVDDRADPRTRAVGRVTP